MMAMRIRLFWILVMLLLQTSLIPVHASTHPVPEDRSSLKEGDWFPYIFSKIAPLEWWSFEEVPEDAKKTNYGSDTRYQASLRDSYTLPRFCFSLFRPSPHDYFVLLMAPEQYQGPVFWNMSDGCIWASASRPRFISVEDFRGKTPEEIQSRWAELARNPPKADPDFVKKALADIPNFCKYLESRMGLETRSPQQFDPFWLTREGLKTSKGEFEDFYERGSWIVQFRAEPPKPEGPGTGMPPAVQEFSFSLGIEEHVAILEELGANLDPAHYDSEKPILPAYPMISRLPDVISDAFFSPAEAKLLLSECLDAQESVKDPKSIRGLDKLVRIAHRAEDQHLGIFFIGED